jgi:ribulose-bisphosphate carboxylase large chain
MQGNQKLGLSGERFTVEYSLFCKQADAKQIALAIIVEDTVEFPYDLLPEGEIKDQIVGKIEELTEIGENQFKLIVSYAIEITAFTIPQLMNVILGNISLMPNIKVERFTLPQSLAARFSGPRFGRDGLRKLLNIPTRPLLSTAIKPMGLTYKELAEMVYQVAKGGIDIVKDDHGISNQPFSRFKDRVQANQDALEKANNETGNKSIFLPNITGRADELLENAYFAKKIGCGGLLVLPAHTGWDSIRMLAEDDNLNLPIMTHIAFHGSYTVSPREGFSPFAWVGQVSRVAGSDMSIFVNFGSRFSNSIEECLSAVGGTAVPMHNIKPNFPVAGGGLTMENVPLMKKTYDNNMIYLMGGGLHKASPDLIANARRFRDLLEV